MTIFICEGIINFLSAEQKDKLNRKFKSPEQNVMPHEIASPLGIKYSESLAILTVLQAADFCQIFLLTYHNCDPDTFIKSTPFEDGFPRIPFECELCQEVIEDINEISFDVMAKTYTSIEFV